MGKNYSDLVLTRNDEDGGLVCWVQHNSEIFKDENAMTVVREVHAKYPHLKHGYVELNDNIYSDDVPKIWEYPHTGFDIIHVDLTVDEEHDYVEILVEDIHPNSTKNQLKQIGKNLITYKTATSVEEAVEYAKTQVKRDYILFITKG